MIFPEETTLQRLKRNLRCAGWSHEPFRYLEDHLQSMESNFPALSYPVSPDIEDPAHLRVLEGMNNGYDHWRHLGFVAHVKRPVIIEDLHGMLIDADSDRLLPNEVLGVHRDVYVAPPFKPSYHMKKRRARRVEGGLVLHHHYGVNFTHFYMDVLSKLVYFYEKGFSRDVPVILFRSYYETPMFQAIKDVPALRGLNFVIQEDDEYLLADNVYVVKPLGLRKEGVLGLRDLCDPGNEDRGGDRKVFLVRSSTFDRGLRNRDEIVAVAESYGFEAIEPSSLGLIEQIELFQQTRYLLAEHGSAEINLLHRKVGTMSSAEFFPQEHIAPIFDIMAGHLGFRHHVFRVPEDQCDGVSYELSPELAKEWIEKLLDDSTRSA